MTGQGDLGASDTKKSLRRSPSLSPIFAQKDEMSDDSNVFHSGKNCDGSVMTHF